MSDIDTYTTNILCPSSARLTHQLAKQAAESMWSMCKLRETVLYCACTAKLDQQAC